MEFEKLQMIIAEVLSVSPDEIRLEMSFIDDLGADSLDIFQIIMSVEEEFDIDVEDSLIEQITTVEDALKLIGEKHF